MAFPANIERILKSSKMCKYGKTRSTNESRKKINPR